MKEIYVNLKRFDVPKKYGGLCPLEDPLAWIAGVIQQTVEMGMGAHPGLQLVYLLPEGLAPTAVKTLQAFPFEQRCNLSTGCQGVHWEDVAPGKNFGAFTTARPASAMLNLGCEWAIIGHSEERRFKLQVMQTYEPKIASDPALHQRATAAINELIRLELQCALKAGLNVLLCVGESAEERGEGSFDEQQPRIQEVLKTQLLSNLTGLPDIIGERKVVIGYEPIWAIGPGKIPPDQPYIAFVSSYIQRVVHKAYEYPVTVVYGGGLKEENAAMIAGIESIGGGLVALTRFSGEIGFDVAGLKGIVEKYL